MLEHQHENLTTPRTLLFKCPLHSKAAIDGHHSFPRRSAERANKHNLGLTLETLIECCEADEQYERIHRERRQRKFKREFRMIPKKHEVDIPSLQNSYSFNLRMQRMINVSPKAIAKKIKVSPVICTKNH